MRKSPAFGWGFFSFSFNRYSNDIQSNPFHNDFQKDSFDIIFKKKLDINVTQKNMTIRDS
jgi:hypothetical protein